MKSIKHYSTEVDEKNQYRVYSLDHENTGKFRLWIFDWVVVSAQDARGSLMVWESFDNETDAIKAYNEYLKKWEGKVADSLL